MTRLDRAALILGGIIMVVVAYTREAWRALTGTRPPRPTRKEWWR